MESLANGSFSPFSNCASGLLSSACSLSCSDKQHYHRHCGCALHSIGTGFKGSPFCSPSCKVKVSRSGARSGMHRSLSVQNFGEKRYNCASCGGNSYSGSESASSFAFSPNSSDMDFCSSGSSFSHFKMRMENVPSVETLTLVEELASFIHLVKDGDSSSTSEDNDDEDMRDGNRWAADADLASFSNAMTFTPNTQHVKASPKPRPPPSNTKPSNTTSLVAGTIDSDAQLDGLLPPAGSLVREASAMFRPHFILPCCLSPLDRLVTRPSIRPHRLQRILNASSATGR